MSNKSIIHVVHVMIILNMMKKLPCAVNNIYKLPEC